MPIISVSAQTFFNTDRRISISWMRTGFILMKKTTLKTGLEHYPSVELKLVTDSKATTDLNTHWWRS